MVSVNLIPIEYDDPVEPAGLLTNIFSNIHIQTGLKNSQFILSPYFDKNRGQFNGAKILDNFPGSGNVKNVILTSNDIFLPIFTHVFGLAQLKGSNALVSSHRLRNSFYGLPDNNYLLEERIIKEVIHELGHTLGLFHCHDYRCVMFSSVSADDLDSKGNHFCDACLEKIII